MYFNFYFNILCGITSSEMEHWENLDLDFDWEIYFEGHMVDHNFFKLLDEFEKADEATRQVEFPWLERGKYLKYLIGFMKMKINVCGIVENRLKGDRLAREFFFGEAGRLTQLYDYLKSTGKDRQNNYNYSKNYLRWLINNTSINLRDSPKFNSISLNVTEIAEFLGDRVSGELVCDKDCVIKLKISQQDLIVKFIKKLEEVEKKLIVEGAVGCSSERWNKEDYQAFLSLGLIKLQNDISYLIAYSKKLRELGASPS